MKKLSKRQKEHIWYLIFNLSPKCFKVFSINSSLNKHMLIHSGERPYICNVVGCFKMFSQVRLNYIYPINVFNYIF